MGDRGAAWDWEPCVSRDLAVSLLLNSLDTVGYGDSVLFTFLFLHSSREGDRLVADGSDNVDVTLCEPEYSAKFVIVYGFDDCWDEYDSEVGFAAALDCVGCFPVVLGVGLRANSVEAHVEVA